MPSGRPQKYRRQEWFTYKAEAWIAAQASAFVACEINVLKSTFLKLSHNSLVVGHNAIVETV
jgi:hypothetical protein